MIFVHVIACAWFFVAYMDGFPMDSWVINEKINNSEPSTQYIRSLYWAIVTMTTVGFGDITPNRNIEYIFTMVVMLLGASLYAFLIGNIASLLSSLNAAKASFWNRIEGINQYLRSRRVPHKLNEQVRNYYEYLWAHHRGIKEDVLFEDLPGPLRLEVLLSLTNELLEKVPLFKYSTQTLRNVLLLALKAETFAPGGYIVREGELGKSIYFISRGTAEITSNEGKNTHGILEDGDYFGDLSLILNEKRTASVQALTYCEIFILTKSDFDSIKNEYPEFKNVLKKMSSEKTEKISTLVLDSIIL
jgi:voltage-gated potassium channel